MALDKEAAREGEKEKTPDLNSTYSHLQEIVDKEDEHAEFSLLNKVAKSGFLIKFRELAAKAHIDTMDLFTGPMFPLFAQEIEKALNEARENKPEYALHPVMGVSDLQAFAKIQEKQKFFSVNEDGADEDAIEFVEADDPKEQPHLLRKQDPQFGLENQNELGSERIKKLTHGMLIESMGISPEVNGGSSLSAGIDYYPKSMQGKNSKLGFRLEGNKELNRSQPEIFIGPVGEIKFDNLFGSKKK